MVRHITTRTWLPHQVEELKKLVEAGASPARAAAHFRRTQCAVQIKAKAEGFPFTDRREVKRQLRAREISERTQLGLD